MAQKGYTTKEDIENYILSDIDSSFDDQIDEWIEAVENIIDKMTNRNFIADTEATARLFDGDGSEKLIIDEAVEITKVEVGNDDYGASFSEVSASGAGRYFLEPSNFTVRNLPVYMVTLRSQVFVCGKQNQRITAKWGSFVAVPEDISFAATVFVAGILNQSRQGGDEIKSEKIGNYQVTYNTDKDGNSWADFSRAMAILSVNKRILI
ncbi:hypothetical protein DRQ25_00775 [Candidatus Fermentibacteria bacterium]|nr:MAG: hypothetical protein DRQ25_00775 [Candidatus Fermentibacteria bacterium]